MVPKELKKLEEKIEGGQGEGKLLKQLLTLLLTICLQPFYAFFNLLFLSHTLAGGADTELLRTCPASPLFCFN